MTHIAQDVPVIGLVGPAGAGKSTIADYLVEHHGFERMSMAGPLKEMLLTMGLDDVDVYGPNGHREAPTAFLCDKSPRWAMQTLGTEWGRKCIGPDVWVNAVQKRIIEHRTMCGVTGEGCGGIIIDDIRFPNEWNMIQNLGGEIWKIRRPDVEKPRRWYDKVLHWFGLHPFLHESEFHWRDAPFNLLIDNTCSEQNMLQLVAQRMEG